MFVGLSEFSLGVIDAHPQSPTRGPLGHRGGKVAPVVAERGMGRRWEGGWEGGGVTLVPRGASLVVSRRGKGGRGTERGGRGVGEGDGEGGGRGGGAQAVLVVSSGR